MVKYKGNLKQNFHI